MARIKSMPFPGESPTVSLAMAAGQKYGLKEKAQEQKPARTAKRKATKKKTRAR